MEPGDLRINARLRDDSGGPKNSQGNSYGASNEGNSVLQFRAHHNVRPDIIRDGRMHHMPSPMGGVPLMLDRNEPVKVWRDPSLMNSGEIRHVVSMQHSGVVHLTHPMVSHGNVSSPVGVYQRHDNKPIDATSRMMQQNAADASRGRAPVVFAPAHAHPPNPSKPGPECWRPPGVHQQQKDFRVNVSGKTSVEQAVQDHFEESLRLAQYKGAPHQSLVVKHDERLNPIPNAPMQRFYPPPHDKRHHELANPQQVIYQIHPQHQALNKPELPTPPPLRSEQPYRTGNPVESNRKHQIYGPPEIISRTHEAALQQTSIRYEQEPNSRLDVFPSDNNARYQKLPSAPRRPPTQNDLHLERNRSPFAKQTPPQGSPNSYHGFPQQAQISKHKVVSPAPPHIYGKPGPSSRPYDMNNDPSAPLPLTSKGGLTRSSQSSPTAYTHPNPTLPQHELRKTDVAFHMYNNAPPGYQPNLSPQAHLHQIQSQPLDLGGKRKLEEEPTYKGPNEYTNPTSIKPIYGSRKPVDDPRSQLPRTSAPVALSLTTSEVTSKRKIEDSALPLHLPDTKKIRSDGMVGSNLVIVRKDHDIKSAMREQSPDLAHGSRPYINNSVPLSLTVSPAEIRIKSESIVSSPPPPPPQTSVVDAEKCAAKPGSSDASPQSVITSAALASSSICNGKHKESITTDAPCSTSNTPLVNQKPEIDTCKVKVEPQIQSSSTSVKSVSASSSTSKFSKVPKKAWVLQWHEGDHSKSTEDSSSTVKGTSTNNEASKTSDSAENSEKLSNGVAVSLPGTEGESKPTVQNGFGREKLNDSDPYSENESDTSGKDKMSMESMSTPKKGRRAKGGGASPKPDLRKDGLCKRPPVSQLKKTGESFIQAETCNRVTPKIGKCRECRWHPSGRGSKKQSGAYCRFYGFRKLRYTKGGSLTVAGFSDPFLDPPKITEHDQFRLWLPSSVAPQGLDTSMSKFLLGQLCDQFCDLVRQEEEARHLARSQELSAIAWKPLLKGVLEMCDVCDTTLFNFHWACGKCGFVVCLSCFKARKNESEKPRVAENVGKDRDEFHWLLCSNRCAHELDKLMLVQTIAGNALTELNKSVHSLCESWRITQSCSCNSSGPGAIKAVEGKELEGKEKESLEATSSKEPTVDLKSETSDQAGGTPTTSDSKISSIPATTSSDSLANGANGISKVESGTKSIIELKNFKRENKCDLLLSRQVIPFKSLTTSDGAELCKNVKHSWFCNGKLVRLLEPFSLQNISVFHELFKRGLPVLVSHVGEKLDKSLWTPESFSKDFGEYKHDLINCASGETLPNQLMKKFWEGFSSNSKRMRDDNGELLALKVKDWPPTDDFAQTLPARFQDLMAALPLPDYTLREGNLNLASRLPTEFMKPDLGPKMYIAYGAGSSLDKGTTNLHLDAADRINVLVHCEIPIDADRIEHDKGVMDAIEESDCDSATVNRVVEDKEVPGALWHVYSAKDADKIRDLLNKIASERGNKVNHDHDAIFEQSWYLDKKLRLRLKTEYDVEGYAILQCEGDAIFVPAGAPHQVRNLQNCIKVSEDFVSPENISQSLYLCEDEMRVVSRAHTNHEDKLQIKNIVYHAVKDASSVLLLQKNEKSEVHQVSSNDALTAPTVLSKDCQFQPSTSPKDFPAMVVNAATN